MRSLDPYRVLGVKAQASEAEIQQAYRKLVRRYHPDVSREPDAEQRFMEVQVAYDVLKDPAKRARYDKDGSLGSEAPKGSRPPRGGSSSAPPRATSAPRPSPPRSPPPPRPTMGRRPPSDVPPPKASTLTENADDAAGEDEESFASSLLSQLFGRRRRRRRRDPDAPVRVRDSETTLSLSILEAFRGGKRQFAYTDAHDNRKVLAVHVPPGIRPGQRIRLAGQGQGGADLYLRVQVAESDGFKLEGEDVSTRVAVSPTEAVLGGTIPVRTLEGEVNVKVPPGSGSGVRVRLRGRGFPKKSGGRGDLYVEVRIQVPRTLEPEERELYEQLARVSTFDPRAK
ncbi:MAG: DnaJ C-terminal domain-containing protein [Sandaracinaceae bacterium]